MQAYESETWSNHVIYESMCTILEPSYQAQLKSASLKSYADHNIIVYMTALEKQISIILTRLPLRADIPYFASCLATVFRLVNNLHVWIYEGLFFHLLIQKLENGKNFPETKQ